MYASYVVLIGDAVYKESLCILMVNFKLLIFIFCICFIRRIYACENLAATFIAVGEGYHNYHHTFPWDYRAAELGSRVNLTTLLINIFQSIGWAYDLKTTSPEIVKQIVEKYGDGSHFAWGNEISHEAYSSVTADKCAKNCENKLK